MALIYMGSLTPSAFRLWPKPAIYTGLIPILGVASPFENPTSNFLSGVLVVWEFTGIMKINEKPVANKSNCSLFIFGMTLFSYCLNTN